MTDVVEQRRELVEELADRAIVDDVDFTRDGFETVILSLGERDGAGDEATPEVSVTYGDYRVTFFTSSSGQCYRQEFEATPERASEDWRPMGIDPIDEPEVEIYNAE